MYLFFVAGITFHTAVYSIRAYTCTGVYHTKYSVYKKGQTFPVNPFLRRSRAWWKMSWSVVNGSINYPLDVLQTSTIASLAGNQSPADVPSINRDLRRCYELPGTPKGNFIQKGLDWSYGWYSAIHSSSCCRFRTKLAATTTSEIFHYQRLKIYCLLSIWTAKNESEEAGKQVRRHWASCSESQDGWNVNVGNKYRFCLFFSPLVIDFRPKEIWQHAKLGQLKTAACVFHAHRLSSINGWLVLGCRHRPPCH